MSTIYLVAGLAYGDEGKGATVDFLTRKFQSSLIVRYNGGPQAAHNVITPDGRHHTFSQFGSGMFLPDVRTHLSKYMLVNPLNMMCEEEHLQEVGIKDAWQRTTVHQQALIITPYTKIVNRVLETVRGDGRNGSCGQGIGETRSMHLTYGDLVLYAGDLGDEQNTKAKLRFIRKKCLEKLSTFDKYPGQEFIDDEQTIDWLWEEYDHWPVRIVSDNIFADQLEAANVVIFEGAQGMMIDEKYGEHPHNTWTDCTFGNAEKLIKEADLSIEHSVIKIGVVRSYYTRHGAGPFPTEDPNLKVPELHNGTNEYQGSFRLGLFDKKAFRYALEKIGGVDWIAVNHLDAAKSLKTVKSVDGMPIGILGWGPTAKERDVIL